MTHKFRTFDLRRTVVAGSVWAAAVVLLWAVFIRATPVVSAKTLLTGLVALVVLALAVKRPDRSLLVLIVLFPFQGLILAKLWAWGLPASIDGHMSAWKETLALGVVIAGARQYVRSGRRADALDRLALGFVIVVLLYAALQPSLIPTAPTATNIRLLGFRETAGFVLVLLGARHAPLGPAFARRAAGALFCVAVVVAGVGVYERFAPHAWNNFVVNDIKYTQYEAVVLHNAAVDPTDILHYSGPYGTTGIRIGSVFLDDTALAWYLLLPLALGIERIIRHQATAYVLVGTGMIAVAELLTETRSGVIGATVVVLAGLLPATGRRAHWRTQTALMITAVLMLGVPVTLGSGLSDRIQQATQSQSVSTHGHISGFYQGIDTLKAHPFGLGVGTSAGTGQRYDVKGYVIPENTYLEIGDEIGIGPGLLFLALTLGLLATLRRACWISADPLTTAAWAAGLGLAVSAIFLQTWSNFAVAWTYWGIAGVGLALARPAPVAKPAAARPRATAARTPASIPSVAP